MFNQLYCWVKFLDLAKSNAKRDEKAEWRRRHNEELQSLYRSYNIDTVVKSRRLRWAGHIDRMEEGRSAFNSYV